MNNVPMTAKEYLSRAYRIDQRINSKLEQLPSLIVESNSIAVEAVSGATLTSMRVINAVTDCLEQAQK